MRVFFAFPGQGTQRPGILHGLNTFGLSVLEEMSNAIGLDLLTLDSAEARTSLCGNWEMPRARSRRYSAFTRCRTLDRSFRCCSRGSRLVAYGCCSFGATSRPLDAGCLSFGIWHDGNRRIEPQYSGRHNECR